MWTTYFAIPDVRAAPFPQPMVKRAAASPAMTAARDKKARGPSNGDGRGEGEAIVSSSATPVGGVRLTAAEESLFAFLLEVERRYACGAVLRVAGGWVRDKLLGRESDDVDVVLDNMTGLAFAERINSFERDHGKAAHAVGVIKANPEQSKHLETATMQLGDPPQWIDLVNLRAETYSDAHRIPDVAIGTPEQDAHRRDFTVNSLFYNISARAVEDLTGRGIDDLRAGVIRTPLDARVTFLDDPLRVLRAVRFAARFKFRLDDALRAAAQDAAVREALVKKVSRERVGKEFVGMLAGSSAHPARALRLLHELRLCQAVFLPPLANAKHAVFTPSGDVYSAPNDDDDPMWDVGYVYAAEMYRYLVKQSQAGDVDEDEDEGGVDVKPSRRQRRRSSVDVSALTEDEAQALKVRVLASFLLPFRDFTVGTKSKRQPLPTYIVLEALKLRNRDAKDVYNVVLKNVSALQLEVRQDEFDRVRVGLLLREVGAQWQLCRDVALVQELVDAGEGESAASTCAEIEQRYAGFAERVAAEELIGVWDLKPLLNGNELVTELQVKRGPAIKQTLDRVLTWQLRHPHKTRDDCIAHFRASASE